MKLQNKAAFLFMLAIGSSVFILLHSSLVDMLWTSTKGTQPLKNLLPQTFLHQTFVQTNTSGIEVLRTAHKIHIANIRKNNSYKLDSQEFVYKNYNPERTRTISLTEDKTDYFLRGENNRCLREGTANSTSTGCKCKSGWHGAACSIPDIVNENDFLQPTKLRLRDGPPRRIIYGMTFNIEFELLEIRLEEMGDLIDVVLILESNYTGFGDQKDLYLLNKMKNGFLKRFQRKIIYLYLNTFPTNPNDPKDGLYTDSFMKSYLSKFGLGLLKETRKDDIFIFADADEIHRREALLFLKLHDGYPEPFGIKMRRNCFGFFWSSGESVLGIGCSLAMLKAVYANEGSELRGATSGAHRYVTQLNQYKDKGNNVQMWQMGKSDPPSLIGGWHCSWCFEPERVRVKLLSAFNYDFPRWGNFPEKTKLEYIRNLVEKGKWFDDQTQFTPLYMGLNAPYAPSFVINHTSRYSRLLFNPFRPL